MLQDSRPCSILRLERYSNLLKVRKLGNPLQFVEEVDLYAEQTKLSFSASLLQINVEISLRLSQRERNRICNAITYTHDYRNLPA